MVGSKEEKDTLSGEENNHHDNHDTSDVLPSSYSNYIKINIPIHDQFDPTNIISAFNLNKVNISRTPLPSCAKLTENQWCEFCDEIDRTLSSVTYVKIFFRFACIIPLLGLVTSITGVILSNETLISIILIKYYLGIGFSLFLAFFLDFFSRERIESTFENVHDICELYSSGVVEYRLRHEWFCCTQTTPSAASNKSKKYYIVLHILEDDDEENAGRGVKEDGSMRFGNIDLHSRGSGINDNENNDSRNNNNLYLRDAQPTSLLTLDKVSKSAFDDASFDALSGPKTSGSMKEDYHRQIQQQFNKDKTRDLETQVGGDDQLSKKSGGYYAIHLNKEAGGYYAIHRSSSSLSSQGRVSRSAFDDASFDKLSGHKTTGSIKEGNSSHIQQIFKNDDNTTDKETRGEGYVGLSKKDGSSSPSSSQGRISGSVFDDASFDKLSRPKTSGSIKEGNSPHIQQIFKNDDNTTDKETREEGYVGLSKKDGSSSPSSSQGRISRSVFDDAYFDKLSGPEKSGSLKEENYAHIQQKSNNDDNSKDIEAGEPGGAGNAGEEGVHVERNNGKGVETSSITNSLFDDSDYLHLHDDDMINNNASRLVGHHGGEDNDLKEGLDDNTSTSDLTGTGGDISADNLPENLPGNDDDGDDDDDEPLKYHNLEREDEKSPQSFEDRAQVINAIKQRTLLTEVVEDKEGTFVNEDIKDPTADDAFDEKNIVNKGHDDNINDDDLPSYLDLVDEDNETLPALEDSTKDTTKEENLSKEVVEEDQKENFEDPTGDEFISQFNSWDEDKETLPALDRTQDFITTKEGSVVEGAAEGGTEDSFVDSVPKYILDENDDDDGGGDELDDLLDDLILEEEVMPNLPSFEDRTLDHNILTREVLSKGSLEDTFVDNVEEIPSDHDDDDGDNILNHISWLKMDDDIPNLLDNEAIKEEKMSVGSVEGNKIYVDSAQQEDSFASSKHNNDDDELINWLNSPVVKDRRGE